MRATLEVFDRASDDTHETLERSYELAGDTVRVRYAGTRLADRFDVPLAPFVTEDPAAPALTISCWDRTTVDRSPPPPPWLHTDHLPRHRIRGFDADGVRATYDVQHGLLHLYDPESRQAVCFAQDAARIPPWTARAPFRALLGWWATDRGLAVVHASAVGGPHGCVLVTGPSGSGKSTTALACVARGFGLVADDVAIVALGAEVAAFASSGIAKVEAGSPVGLDELGGTVVEVHGAQTMLDLGGRVVRRAPVRAVIAASVGADARCRVERLAPASCFRALAGHSVVEALSGDQRSLPALRELARRVPAYRIELGSDLDDVVATVCVVLERSA